MKTKEFSINLKVTVVVCSIIIAISLLIIAYVVSTNKEINMDDKESIVNDINKSALEFYKEPTEEAFIYKNLPEKPIDFIIIKRELEEGSNIEVCNITKEYYLQPDFYKKWENLKDRNYINHNYKFWAIHGYGVYPNKAGITAKNISKGENESFCTFLKSGIGTETYQGVKIVPVEDEYFNTNIEVIDSKYGDSVLLEPTFPEFPEKWVYMIKTTITAKKEVPKGEYKLGFKISSPNQETKKIMDNDVLSKETIIDSKYIYECMDDFNEIGDYKNYTQCFELMMNRKKQFLTGGMINVEGEEGRFFTIIVNVI